MAIQSTLVTTSSAAIYGPVASGQEHAITTLFFCNYSVSDVVLQSVNLVKSGATATNTNKIIHNLTISAGETFTFDAEKIVLEAGDKVEAIVDANTRLSVTVSSLRVA
jgi:hypothetical protein